MRGIWVVLVLLFASVTPAAAQQAGSPVYLADGGGTISLAAADGNPLLADAKDPNAQWGYDKTTLLYKHVVSGLCLTAQSPVDGVTLRMMACDDKDRHQQWRRAASTPGIVVITNVASARCLTAEAPAAGSRLYQEVCSLVGVSNRWAAGGRTLGILSGNGQRLTTAAPGEPFVVKVIGENGQVADGVSVSFFVRSARPKNVLTFEGGAETATAKTGADGKAGSPKVVLGEAGEFESKFTGSASLDDGNTITFEGSCLC